MLRVCAIASAVLAAASGCGKDKVDESKLVRSGEGPAVVVLGGPAKAAGLAAESEPNDPEPQAIALGSGVQGTLNGATDVDRYSFSVSERGMLFALAKEAADADLIVELFDSEGKSLALSDRGPASTSEGVAGLFLEPGSYQVVVSEFTKKKLRKSGGRQGESEPYELRIEVRGSAEEGYELEDNAELSGASEILAGEERYGYLGWKGDTDLWRMPVVGFDNVDLAEGEETRPALHIVLSGVPGLETSLRLRDSDGGEILTRKSGKGQEVAIRNFVPELAAESYLIEVLSSRSNPEDSYLLRVEDAQLARGSEEEPNDELASATLVDGEAGTLMSASGELCLGDVDMFSVAAAGEERILEVELTGPGDAVLEIAVIAESGAVVSLKQGAQPGEALRLVSVSVAANMSPVLRVQPVSIKGPASYKLTMSLVAGRAPPPAPAPEPIVPISE